MQLGDGQPAERAATVDGRTVRGAADMRGVARELGCWRGHEGRDVAASGDRGNLHHARDGGVG